jgi:serine/threonine-protein kinase
MSLVGKKLGERFSVKKLLGRGGMGAVYQVKDEAGKLWAAKVISEGVTKESPSAMKRFAREAEAATTIKSPHVVKTIEADSDANLGLPFIIMELMQGSDLSHWMKKLGAFKPKTAVRLMMQAAYGVSAAHKQGIIHRDIKPANLFLHSDDESDIVTVKVCDFGVAKRTQMAAYDSSSYNLTRTGRMLGSPMYMSPEQARSAKHVDERSDVWSLSVVLWELLSGQRLWADKKSLGELVLAICSDPIPKLGDVAPWVPKDLSNVVARGLERDVERRHQKVVMLAQALESFSSGSFDVQAADLVTMPQDEADRLSAEALDAAPTRISRAIPIPAPKIAYVGEQSPEKSTGALWLSLGALLIVALGVVAALL